MTDTANSDELIALRERIAQLEAKRPKLHDVENHDLVGLWELSRALEAQQLDAFMLNKSVPDRVFWGWFWGFMIVVAAVLGYGLVMYW